MRIVNPIAPLTSPPLWREALTALEAARLVRDPIFQGDGVPDARGQPVLLIPGLLAGDGSLGLMTRWLRRTGHHTRKAGIRLNVNCSGRVIGRLETCLEKLVEHQGRPAAIIGQSRGGSFAKVLAQRRPDLVSGVVTLGTPQVDPLAVHPLVALNIVAVGALGTLRVPGLFSQSCITGVCCTDFWDDFASPLREEVGFLSIYSRKDGIVDWRACLDPSANHFEIGSSHCGMGFNADAYRAIADALADFRKRDERPERRATSLRRAA